MSTVGVICSSYCQFGITIQPREAMSFSILDKLFSTFRCVFPKYPSKSTILHCVRARTVCVCVCVCALFGCVFSVRFRERMCACTSACVCVCFREVCVCLFVCLCVCARACVCLCVCVRERESAAGARFCHSKCSFPRSILFSSFPEQERKEKQSSWPVVISAAYGFTALTRYSNVSPRLRWACARIIRTWKYISLSWNNNRDEKVHSRCWQVERCGF